MISNIKVHAGDFMGGGTYAPTLLGRGFGTLRLRKGSLSVLGDKITKDMIQTVEVASEESAVRLGGAAGWGLAGTVLLGPVGLLAGLVLGGRGKDVTFILILKDGRKILATTDSKAYQAIAATVF